MDRVGENPRGVHALKLLSERRNLTLDGLVDTAFDSWLPTFARLLPGLFEAYDRLDGADPRKAELAEPIATLRAWDDRWAADSVATSLAVFWGEDLYRALKAETKGQPTEAYDFTPSWEPMALKAPGDQKLAALQSAVERLRTSFGTWKTPWGEINRFQRLDDSIQPHFDDSRPSIPVAFTSSQWGSLASFGARALSEHEEVLRDLGQQLRGGGGVRAAGEGPCGHGRRRERRSALAALRRRGRTLRLGRPARGLLLSRRAEGPHGPGLSPGRLDGVRANWAGSPARTGSDLQQSSPANPTDAAPRSLLWQDEAESAFGKAATDRSTNRDIQL